MSTQGLALAGQLGRTVQHGLRATKPSNDLTTAPQRAQPKDPVEKPDRPAVPPRPLAYTAQNSPLPTHEYVRGGSRLKRSVTGGISCAAGLMASSLAKPVQGCPCTVEGTSVDHSRSCACCGGIGGRHPHPGDNRLPVGGRWCDPVDPRRHGPRRRWTQALLLNRDLPAGTIGPTRDNTSWTQHTRKEPDDGLERQAEEQEGRGQGRCQGETRQSNGRRADGT